MKEEPTDEIHRTNFDGDWNDECPHCGRKQKEHRKTYGPLDGVIHEHRLPCEPEKNKIQEKHRNIVRMGNWIVTGMDLAAYGISKIPFLEETKLAKRIVARHLGYKIKKTTKPKT